MDKTKAQQIATGIIARIDAAENKVDAVILRAAHFLVDKPYTAKIIAVAVVACVTFTVVQLVRMAL